MGRRSWIRPSLAARWSRSPTVNWCSPARAMKRESSRSASLPAVIPIRASPSDGAATTPIEQVTALGVDPGGSVVLAGRAEGVNAAVIVRLQANGELDLLFGNEGTTWIDLPSTDAEEEGLPPVGAAFYVNDMTFDEDGGVTVAGGDNANQTGPAVARLLRRQRGGQPGRARVSCRTWSLTSGTRRPSSRCGAPAVDPGQSASTTRLARRSIPRWEPS